MIVVKIFEGLGNQMFQYAFARAIQEKTEKRVYLDNEQMDFPPYKIVGKRKYGLCNFNITLRVIKLSKTKQYAFLQQRNLIEEIKLLLSEKGLFPIRTIYNIDKPYRYYKEFLQVKKNECYIGFFQNEKYFHNIRSILLEEFKPKKEIIFKDEISLLLQSRVTIAVHIRRGDFVITGSALNKIYYDKAMQYLLKKLEKSNPIILFFSDDIKWVKKNIKCEADCYYVNENGALKDYEELILMSKCTHNIISKSTFSWWGAWLNENKNQIVIMPKGWMQYKKKGWIELL